MIGEVDVAEIGEIVESEDLALPVSGDEGGGGDVIDDRFRFWPAKPGGL